MLSVGVAELVLIALVVLLVVGPDDLPRLLRDLGRRYGQLRRAADDLRRAFVLEADRQDAEERYQKLMERRKQAEEARKRALEEAGEGVVAQDRPLPGTEEGGEELPLDARDIAGFEDPWMPAHRPPPPPREPDPLADGVGSPSAEVSSGTGEER